MARMHVAGSTLLLGLALAASALRVAGEPPRGGVAEMKELRVRFAAQSDELTAPATKKYADALQSLLRDLKLHRDFRDAMAVQQELNLLVPGSNAVPGSAETATKSPPPALQRLRRNYQADLQAVSKPLLGKYQAALESLLQRLMQAGDLDGIEAVQQEIKAVKAGASSINAITADYVETVWAWGPPGANGAQEKITFWRDGQALLNTTAMRYQPVDATRINVLYSDGGVWKNAYVVTFDFAKGTMTATHVAGAVIHGKYLGRAPPAGERPGRP